MTGDEGVSTSLFGSDLLGDLVDSILGENNGVSQITGTPDGSEEPGFVPELADALANDPSNPVIGDGLGVSGEGGLVADLLGEDVAGSLLGEGSFLGANLGGGNDGVLGETAEVAGEDPLLGGLGDLLPEDLLTGELAGLDGLGLTDEGGLVEDLVGTDLVGNIVGTEDGLGGLLGDGDDGALGSALNDQTDGLDPAGDLVTDTLDAIAGNGESPLGDILGGLGGDDEGLPVVGGVLDSLTGGLGGDEEGLPIVGGVLDSLTGDLGGEEGLPIVGGVLDTVTGGLGGEEGLPVVGDVLDTVTGGLGGEEGLPVVGDVLDTVTGGLGGDEGLPVVGDVLGSLTGEEGLLGGGLLDGGLLGGGTP